MADIITTLHPENNPNDDLYPNIKGENIPDGAVTTSKLASNSVSEGKIQDAAVTTTKLSDGAVTTTKIIDENVTTSKIQDGAITRDKLATNSVTEGKIQDNAVTEYKIADYSVTTTKIADGAVTRVNLSEDVNSAIDAPVTTSKLADYSVTTTKIGSGAVTSTNLATNSVTENKIYDGAVTRNKIRSGAVTKDKLSSTVNGTIDSLGNKIGNLLDLTTETKADLVSAINEVNENSVKHLYRHQISISAFIDNTYDTYLAITIYTNNSQIITEETLKDYIYRDTTNGGITCNGKFDNGVNSTILTILYYNQQYYIWLSDDTSFGITSFNSFEDVITQIF